MVFVTSTSSEVFTPVIIQIAIHFPHVRKTDMCHLKYNFPTILPIGQDWASFIGPRFWYSTRTSVQLDYIIKPASDSVDLNPEDGSSVFL
jgi:hypothetical protein